MSDRSRLRLVVLQVLVLSLMLTLVGRVYYLQVVTSDHYESAANQNRVREVSTPAPRGEILDDRGRALASNTSALVVSVSWTQLVRQPDKGVALLHRVADVLGEPYQQVRDATRLCSEKGAPRPACWNGLSYQPIPVSRDADPKVALQISERSEDFPGVTAELQTVRQYPEPMGALAPHELGYLGPVTQAEVDASGKDSAASGNGLTAQDQVGRTGLEKSYDADLRGTPGVRKVSVDLRNQVIGTVGETAPVPGNTVVTHLDAAVQAVAEKQLLAAITRARTTGDVNKGGKEFKADSGAVVVMDVRTGGVVAMASYPSYDPNVWVGGISAKDYAAISSQQRNYPSQSRAFQGEFAPGSTFKVVTLPGALQSGYYGINQDYDCPSAYPIGSSLKRNYESKGYGSISLERAIEVSCDTLFYQFAYEQWLRDGGNTPKKDPADPMLTMAHAYHLGQKTGIDLPAERAGRIPDRAWKRSYWEATKANSCVFARTGYPGVRKSDPTRAAFLKKLAAENCTDGYKFRGGDAANFAIGQGDALVTPLQMATVYAAVANGGTLWEPHVAKAVVAPDGTLVRAIAPKVNGHLPVTKAVMDFLHRALPNVSKQGTGAGAFASVDFPLTQLPVASKTGTAEVYGKQSTSWFASYAPAQKPRYAIVMMVSQGGTGSGVSGPSVAGIYESLFGVKDGAVRPAAAILPGGAPPAALPRIEADGTVCAPPGTRYARRDPDAAPRAC